MSMGLRAAACLALLLAAGAAWAAPPDKDPGWPCQQRLVPTLDPGNYWPDLPGVTRDWHADPRVAALVQDISPRAVSEADGVARIEAFRHAAGADAGSLAPLAFTGLTDETNRARAAVIDRIRALTGRQREIAQRVAAATTELGRIPDDPAHADQRRELTERRGFMIRTFNDTQRTMRYACEAPVQLEARLGAYAAALRAK